jgi:hypothetical protein
MALALLYSQLFPFLSFFFRFILFLSLIFLSLAGGDKAAAVAATGSTSLCA